MGIINKDQFEEFKKVSEPLMKWMNDNMDPHSIAIVDSTSAKLMDGIAANFTDKFIED